MLEDEREHYRTLSGLIRNRRPMPQASPEQAKQSLEELLATRQEGRRQAAGWIGDAIYGINDGLGAIFGIVSGVSGATLGDSKFVIIAGMVGMIASALSMGSGAYLAANPGSSLKRRFGDFGGNFFDEVIQSHYVRMEKVL